LPSGPSREGRNSSLNFQDPAGVVTQEGLGLSLLGVLLITNFDAILMCMFWRIIDFMTGLYECARQPFKGRWWLCSRVLQKGVSGWLPPGISIFRFLYDLARAIRPPDRLCLLRSQILATLASAALILVRHRAGCERVGITFSTLSDHARE
jgi:hypothetical protein